MIEQLQKRYKEVSHQVQRRIGQRDQLLSQERQLREKFTEKTKELTYLGEAKKLLELFVKSKEEKIRLQFEPVITEGLQFVFSQQLHFHLYMTTRRNQSEIDFIILMSQESEDLYQHYVKENDEKGLEKLIKETKNINYLYGGAVNQVLALILRFINVELLKIKGPIFLDEPSSAVGEEYSSRLGQLISSMSQRFNRQYILVTHSKSLASYAQKVYEVTQQNFVSKVKELSK